MNASVGESEEPIDDTDRPASLIAEYTVEIPNWRDITNGASGMQFTLEQMVACDPETVAATFWAEAGDFDAFETALRQSNSITDVTVLDEQTDGRTLYRVRLPAAETTYWAWIDLGGVLLGGTGANGSWTLRMRFPNRQALRAYRKHCKEHGISFRLKTLRKGGSSEKCPKMTTPQYEMLEMAVGAGYFEVPRGITLSELANSFEISDQAASERLRRGLSNILTTATYTDHKQPTQRS
ncbi:helix-turn-helix domain-containing protein [Halococcus sediminicola]|uniref:helix-turn-helix domain-containing protein n=1 Tax=Halococcus sediminicola TaxID=1264579 RepID=UPI0006789938|nr:bacterio-opsin activator domain-containing protein [Halococcus sediminicola]